MRAGLKVALAAGAVAAAVALLVVLYAGARQRALVSHCRNNLRHLGGLAERNWDNLVQREPGRLFWHEIREAVYHSANGKWAVPEAQPFTCPVLGRGAGNPEDPASIDYLGPRALRKSARETPKAEPIGADRPGNHPSGGLVLRLDTSVENAPPVIAPAEGEAWEEARKYLKD